MTTTAHEAAALNVMDAAQVWLQRIGASAEAVAVVNVKPVVWVGIWQPGAPNVRRLAAVDDPAAELAEAAAPFIQHGLALLPPEGRAAVAGAVDAGAQLQLLALPVVGELRLRLLHVGRDLNLAEVHIATQA